MILLVRNDSTLKFHYRFFKNVLSKLQVDNNETNTYFDVGRFHPLKLQEESLS